MSKEMVANARKRLHFAQECEERGQRVVVRQQMGRHVD